MPEAKRAKLSAEGAYAAAPAAPTDAAASAGAAVRTAALARLRASMKKQGVAAYIVPSEDAHMSEYVSARDKRRAFLSGFTGSSGTALVTADKAFVWTDGRYFAQAGVELAPPWKLMKDVRHATGRAGEDPPLQRYLADQLPRGARVGIDPWLVSVDTVRRWQQDFERPGVELVLVPLVPNLIDAVWDARPVAPPCVVWPHAEALAGRSVAAKLTDARTAMAAGKASALLVTALDEIAWLFNLRGWGDVAFSPVVVSYAIITPADATLFIDDRKLDGPIRQHLQAAGVGIAPYAGVEAALKTIVGEGQNGATPAALTARRPSKGAAGGEPPAAAAPAAGTPSEAVVWLDPGTCCLALSHLVPAGRSLLRQSPLAVAKALKTPAELAGMRAAHVRDGAAIVRWLAWLDGQMQARFPGCGYFGKSLGAAGAPLPPPAASVSTQSPLELTETSAADVLAAERATEDLFVGLSFPTIAAAGANASIIHYEPSAAHPVALSPDAIFLCDSGGHYRDGTTDVTRTLHFGQPSPHVVQCCTLVLKGHIGLDRAIFPPGTFGHSVDSFARQALWRAGLDYRHGTGHGVGAFLSVHEGPQYVGQTIPAHDAALQAGMTVTDEPGYYEDGAFGCRIENVMLVAEGPTQHCFGGKPFLRFEHVTWVPLQRKLIDVTLLDADERAWIDEYHAGCRAKLGPRLESHPAAQAFLLAATVPLQESDA